MVIYKTLETPKQKYVYDRNTHSIVAVSEKDYAILQENEEMQKHTTLAFKELLNQFQANGLLTESTIKKIEHPELHKLTHHLSKRMHQVILQITQDCNLRCSYCTYSGIYNNRTHSSKRMSFDVAKKSLDFFLSRSSQHEILYLGFYGGEPLLDFKLIKSCVNYIEQHLALEQIHYSITTNGTLLSNEIVKFFIAHDFKVILSIDGTQKDHDANRKFLNGEGSFVKIMENLEKIQIEFPEFINNISVNCVLNPKQDYANIRNFFQCDEIFGKAKIMMNMIKEDDLKSKHISFSENFYVIRKYEYLLFLLSLINRVDLSLVPEDIRNARSNICNNYNKMTNTTSIGEIAHHNGPCIAGCRRLLVDVDGNFFPCERVSEGEAYGIGNINEGFLISNIEKILNIGKLTEDKCKNCWALLTCSMCAANSLNKKYNTLSSEEKEKHCPSSKNDALNTLVEICTLKEFGFNFREV